MKYNLYIYGTESLDKTSLIILQINKNIIKNRCKDDFNILLKFDAVKIKKIIENTVGKSCNITIKKYSQKSGEIAYLHIVVPYKIINEVLPKLLAITEENKLVLYDAEVEKIYYKEIDNESFVQLKIREKQIRRKILKEIAPIYKIRQLLSCHYFYNHIASEFVVTLNEIIGISFKERILELYNCLKANLQTNEELVLVDKCFNICCEDYIISFCVEGYGGKSDKLGYIKEKFIIVEELNRISVEEGFVWLSNVTHTNEASILEAMKFPDLIHKFPNQAERFVEIIKLSERLDKQPFDIGISSLNSFNNNCEIYVRIKNINNDRDSIHKNKHYSLLRLGGNSLYFLGNIISKYYPNLDERCYSFTNPIVPQVWLKIVNRVKQLKDLIEKDIDNSKLKEFIGKLHSFNFDNSPKDEWLEPLDLIKKYKNEICEMLSIFIEWSESQLDEIDWYEDFVFNLASLC